MSCWVVPTVAAELWGLSVEAVLDLIRQQKVPAKQDYHFLLVDVAPQSPTMAMVSHEEQAALHEGEDEASGDYDGETTPTISPGAVALNDIAEEESSWVRIRQRTALRRVRPAA